MESISKSKIQGVWDPAHSTRMGIIAHSTRIGITSGCRHYTRLPPLHPAAAITLDCRHFPPGCSHPEFYCHRHSTRMFHIRNSDAGWERRAFQLPRSDISRSSDSAHPETDRHFEIFFCIVLRCSPEASRYVRPTLRDILL